MTVNNLGVAQRLANQIDAAQVSFKKAVELKGDDAEFRFNLATTYRRKGQVDEAISQYTKAIELKDSFAPAHYDLGIMFEQKRMHDEAIAHFQRYLALTSGKNPKMDEEIKAKIKALSEGTSENPKIKKK